MNDTSQSKCIICGSELERKEPTVSGKTHTACIPKDEVRL